MEKLRSGCDKIPPIGWPRIYKRVWLLQLAFTDSNQIKHELGQFCMQPRIFKLIKEVIMIQQLQNIPQMRQRLSPGLIYLSTRSTWLSSYWQNHIINSWQDVWYFHSYLQLAAEVPPRARVTIINQYDLLKPNKAVDSPSMAIDINTTGFRP